MIYRKKNIISLLIFIVSATIHAQPPKLTLIIFVDQLNQQTLNTIKPHLTGGLNYLINNGLVYQNAHWPFAMPSTATGHAGFSTGTYPANNGISDNSWISAKGKKVRCDDDTVDHAAVFAPNGFYNYGKSARKLMVDTITDQFILQSNKQKKHGAFTLSFKSRSAIMLAGSLGKAIWYDEKGKQFTSSKAYFTELPTWLKRFNAQKPFDQSIVWQSKYPQKNLAYQSAWRNDYTHTREQTLIGQEVPSNDRIYTPQAQQVLFDLAQQCLENELDKFDQFLLGISFSCSDKIGHKYGPNSVEYYDMLYHFDHQLNQFLSYLKEKLPMEEILIVFTTDHGSMPIPELMQKRGYFNARRIHTKKLENELNRFVAENFNITDAVRQINVPDIYLNHQLINTLSNTKRNAIINAIKKYVKGVPGFKNVWTYDELANSCVDPNSIEFIYKKQLFPRRSGDLIFAVFPYTYVSKHVLGTGHKSPYEYDTHIPLILYQKGIIEERTINNKVYGCQLANTLSWLMDIPCPSSSSFEALPGVKV